MRDWLIGWTPGLLTTGAFIFLLVAMQNLPSPGLEPSGKEGQQAQEPLVAPDHAMGGFESDGRPTGPSPAVTDPAAEPQPVFEVPMGERFTWSPEDVARPIRFRSGGVLVTIRTAASALFDDLIVPRITIEGRDGVSRTIDGVDTRPHAEHRIGIGRLNNQGHRFAYYEAHSGGAHCCLVPTVVVVRPGTIQERELGSWDQAIPAGGHFPRDEDGDGHVDFVQRDDRFRYVFGGGGDSYGPPQILSIEDGATVDVSARPSFRPLFIAQMRESRRLCLHPNGRRPNGHCAAYVAAAARVGRFNQAWQEMLRAYDSNSDIELPQGCRFVTNDAGSCPPGGTISFSNYPDALRHFLRMSGYISS